MPKFTVTATQQVEFQYTIEADSLTEAWDLAENSPADFDSIEYNPEITDWGSINIDNIEGEL